MTMVIACSSKPAVPTSPVVALVNQTPIYAEELEKTLQSEQWKFGLNEAKQQVLESIIKTRLLTEEAKKRGITVTAEELEQEVEAFRKLYQNDAALEKTLAGRGLTLELWKEKRRGQILIRNFVNDFGNNLSVNEMEIQSFYQKNRAQFSAPEQVQARHIVTDSREKAEKLREKLMAGTDFATLAQNYSLSPDRQQGGNLGSFSRGTMPPSFDEVCFGLKMGEISPVVQTEYGFHIFQVLARKPARNRSSEEARVEIANLLREQKGKQKFEEWYDSFRKNVVVTIDEKAWASFLEKSYEKSQ